MKTCVKQILTASVEEVYCSASHRITFRSVSLFPWAVVKSEVAARALLLYQRMVTVGSSVWYLLGRHTHNMPVFL